METVNNGTWQKGVWFWILQLDYLHCWVFRKFGIKLAKFTYYNSCINFILLRNRDWVIEDNTGQEFDIDKKSKL